MKGERDIPYIRFQSNGVFWIKGRSFPEDASQLYEPLLRWLELYKEDPAPRTVFTIDLESFNIGSSKYLLYLIYHLGEILSKKDVEVLVEWVHEEGDEDMIEVGADYEVMARVPFRYRLRSPQLELARSALISSS